MQRCFRGQGATEYLVLLAVVLVIALVSIALLGFFPGTAGDAQMAQNQIYWQSARPISIVESGAKTSSLGGSTYNAVYLRLRNMGNYRIKITKFLGNGTSGNSGWDCVGGCSGTGRTIDLLPASDLPAGGETYYADNTEFGIPSRGEVYITLTTAGKTDAANIASTICNPTGSPSKGTLLVRNFGFEYIAYIDGQQITKQQIGKDLVMKCT